MLDLLCEREPFVQNARMLFAYGYAGIQHMSAIKEKVDCIVTRNKKDFMQSIIPVYTIDELMSLM